MSDYDNPRPAAGTPYSDPCAVKDMATTLGKVVDGNSTVTTYNGNQILSLSQVVDKFGFGEAAFTFATGGTLENKNLLVSNEPVDGFLYKYVGAGSAPIVVTAGTDPTAGSDWQAFAATSLQALSGLTAPSELDNVYTRTFDSVSSLESTSGLVVDTVVRTKGYNSSTDDGGGEYLVSATSTKPANRGSVVALAGGLFAILQSPVTPKRFGCVGDGVADDTNRLEALFTSGEKVTDDSKSKYRVTREMDMLGSFDIDLGESSVLLDVADDVWRVVRFNSGSMTNIVTPTSIAYYQTFLTARLCVAITLDDASAYNIGDSIKVVSEDPINPFDVLTEYCGQAFEIVGKSGNILYTHNTTDIRFTTAPRVAKFTTNTCKLKNINILSARPSQEPTSGQIAISVDSFVNPIFDNITGEKGSFAILRVFNCFRARGGKFFGKDLNGDTTKGQNGYVVVDYGSTESTWDAIEGVRVRHVYTTGAENHAGNKEPEVHGGAVNCFIDKIIGRGCHSFAADTHQDSYNTNFNSVVCYSGGQERTEQSGAVQFRGWKDQVVDINHVGPDHGVLFGWGVRSCHVGKITSRGGRIITTITNTTTAPTISVDYAHLIVDDKQTFGMTLQHVNARIGTYHMEFQQHNNFNAFKTMISLRGSSAYNLFIDNLIIDTTNTKTSEFSSYIPVALLSDWGDIYINKHTLIQGGNMASGSHGLFNWINSADAVARSVNLTIRDMNVYTNFWTLSQLLLNIKGGLITTTSKIIVDYKIKATDGTATSIAGRRGYQTNGEVLVHGHIWSASQRSLPYLQSSDNLTTMLSNGAGLGSKCVLCPPATGFQRWDIFVESTSPNPAVIEYKGGVSVTVPAGEMRTFLATGSGVWNLVF